MLGVETSHRHSDSGLARFVKVPAADGKGRELNLWIVDDAGGFQVLRFTDWYSQTLHGKAIYAEAVARSYSIALASGMGWPRFLQ
jgi:hypothetical protein